MATVAGPGALPPDSLRPGGGGAGGGGPLKAGNGMRRKTPSELRGEQLKRANVIELVDESPAPHLGSVNNNGEMDSLKMPGVLKPPRYIDVRVDEVYPAKKSRFNVISAKANAKNKHQFTGKPCATVEEMREVFRDGFLEESLRVREQKLR